MSKPPISLGIRGIAGEYYVAAELSRRNLIAALTMKNSNGVDIIASRVDGSNPVSIQVKTRVATKQNYWIVKEILPEHISTSLFFVFVTLPDNDDASPEFLVVPSDIVRTAVKSRHENYIMRMKDKGRTPKESKLRKFSIPDVEKYRNNWNILFSTSV